MADRICDNCMSRVPQDAEQCPKCGIHFENTNPGGALPNGWVLGGRYTVGRYIDIDGEGVSYSAIDSETLQRVTIKEFMPVTLCASRSEGGQIMAKPGCEVLFKTTKLDFIDLFTNLQKMGLAEGLVQVLDTLEENNTSYAVLEKIEGPTLAEYLTKAGGPIDSNRAIALLRPVMSGVEALHLQNLVHRGISPDNIILESGGTAKLTGYATLALRQQGSEFKPKLYPGYSAPEQYAASEFEGRYTDIYALGAILFRMLTGTPPVPADERRVQDTLPNPRSLNKSVPAFLAAGIARSMRLVPAERIQSIPDLRLALSGEGAPEARGPLGLTKKQLIIGGIAGGAILLLLLILLIVSIVGGGDDDSSSSLSTEPSTSLSEAELKVPNFVGKVYEDVHLGKNSEYQDFVFGEKKEEYSDDVDIGIIISQTPDAGEVYDGRTPIVLTVSLGPETVVMPDFVSSVTTEATARAELAKLGVSDDRVTTVTVVNTGSQMEGSVVGTTPLPGVEFAKNTGRVTLRVAGPVAQVPVPDVKGQSEADAVARLNNAGLQATVNHITNTVGRQYNGKVESTNPAAGTSVNPGTPITINVYGSYMMPNLDSYNVDGSDPAGLTAFLDAHNIPFTTVTVTNPGGKTADSIQRIEYDRNVAVTDATKVTIYVYGPDPSSTP